MDLEEALRVVFAEAERRGQNQVAADLGVSNGTVSKWRNSAMRPEGAVKGRVFAFAESVLGTRTPLDAATKALEATGRNVAKLAEIRGYAAAVLSMLRSVTAEQEKVVDSLAPYVEAEGRFLAAQVPESELAQIAESVKRSAAQATPGRKKKGSAG